MSKYSGWVVLVVVGCGPVVSGSGDDGSSGSDDATSLDTTASTTVGSTTVGSTTVGSTTVGSTTVGSSTTDSTSEETTDPSADTASFVDGGNDMGGTIYECDQWAQDCPEGEKCMPWANDGGSSWNATRCTPIDPNPSGIGQPCTVEGSGVSGIDNCDLGAMCFNVDPETNMGECYAFCQGNEANPTCADECSWCALSGDGVLILCIPTCDPIAQDCDEGQGCYPGVEGFACLVDASEEAGGVGEPCEFLNVCDPGTFCADASMVPGCEGLGCCAPYCDLAGAADCSALPGTSCVPWTEEPDPFADCGAGQVGACVAQ